MIIQKHTSTGIVEYELTQQELEEAAAKGDLQARYEIVLQQYPIHSSPHDKVQLIAYLMGIIDILP